MCFNLLTNIGTYITRSSVIPIPNEDLNTTLIKTQMETFISSMHNAIGDHNKAVVRRETINDDELYYDAFFDVAADDNNTLP